MKHKTHAQYELCQLKQAKKAIKKLIKQLERAIKESLK